MEEEGDPGAEAVAGAGGGVESYGGKKEKTTPALRRERRP